MKPTEVHELEQQMEALAREYAETHDQKIIAAMKGNAKGSLLLTVVRLKRIWPCLGEASF